MPMKTNISISANFVNEKSLPIKMIAQGKRKIVSTSRSKQHRDDVVTDRESFVRAGFRIDAALVRAHLVLPIFIGRRKRPRMSGSTGNATAKTKKTITGRYAVDGPPTVCVVVACNKTSSWLLRTLSALSEMLHKIVDVEILSGVRD